jgi:MFS family permease
VKTLLPWLVAVAFFMESLDTTILNTAVPSIAAALHVAPLSMKVALTSYTLSLAVFIPVSGWMADRYGTRRVFATAIGIFSLGSFLCGVASMGSSIASTIQQMSMSFGVAVASLATAVFVPDRFRATPLEMMSGIHEAFVVLDLLTVVSALVFRGLRAEDGANVSRHLPVTNDSLAVAGASSHEGVSGRIRAG